MRVSAFVVPFFAILAGVVGFNLRMSEHHNVFDAVTGLPYRNAATTVWLTVLSFVFVLAIIIFAIKVASKHKALPGFESAYGTDPFIYPVIIVVIAIVWVIGSFMYFSHLNTHNSVTMNDIYFIAFSVISAAATAFFAIEMYQDSRRNAAYALSIIPTIFMCFWLIFLYRHNASNPVLLSYIYQCLAIVTSALGFYYTSGFLYGKPAPGKAIVTYYTAIYFSFISLADILPMGIKLIFCSLIGINLVHSSMLIRNLQRKSDADYYDIYRDM
ncbi:MAG: hypothetical protein FWD38_04970 [Oscillospiraceae bacterium]|nr:hypothetical protein [Oscillospiraceae bacterium]